MTTADLADLMAKAIDSEIEEDGSFAVEDDGGECALCTSCKEWANIIRVYDANGDEIETMSGCCGAALYEF